MPAQVQMHCLKCRSKTASRNVQGVTIKNGRPGTQAICAECGAKKFRLGSLP